LWQSEELEGLGSVREKSQQQAEKKDAGVTGVAGLMDDGLWVLGPKQLRWVWF
jgi:hypothetical protein